MLRHPPVGDRDLLGTDRVGEPAHLARVVAEPFVDVIELDDRDTRHAASLPVIAIEYREWRASQMIGRSGRSATRKRPHPRRVHPRLGIVFLDSTVVNVALPAIEDDLGGGLVLQQWVVDAYLLTLGSLLLVGGSLGDLFGARRLFLIGDRHLRADVALLRAAPDGTTLIFARGLQGVAGALLTPAALAMIASTFQGEERGAAIGTWTAWTGIAFVIGPLLGGWLVSLASWRWVFIINPPFALLTARTRPVARAECHRTRERARESTSWAASSACRPRRAGLRADRGAATRGFGDPVILVALFGGILAASPRSSSGNAGHRSRCCPCGSSGSGTSPARTSRPSTVYAGSPRP